MSREYRISASDLQEFATEVFARAGLPHDDAATEAEVLVWANLRGVDSHGVLRIPQYLHSIEAGGMNPRPNIRIERQTPATLLIEADHAFGPVVTKMAMREAIAKAKNVGIGWAAIRNTTHQGAMGYYALMAAQEGLAGLTFVCNPPNMAPYGARAAGVHNSPIAIAVPAATHEPLVLDMATSIAAGGKVSLAVDKGVPIPLGWALDTEGRPTTDATLAKILMPSGGYKGSGLAMMFECLSSLLVGNPLLEATLVGGPAVRVGTQNSVVAAVDIASFTDVAEYKAHVDRIIDGIRALPPAEGFREVLAPGDVEARVRAERERDGIPLPAGTAHNLREVAGKLGIPCPAELLD
jgi:ureidoglycolate dehydrogenase (NAD+)